MITKGEKVINRGITPKDGCDETGTSIPGAVITLANKLKSNLNDDSITHKCCSWSCCNYNTTLADLASPPTLTPNISIAGLVWPVAGSMGCSFTYCSQLIILLILTLNILYNYLS